MTRQRYKPTFPDLARQYAEQGATDREVAEMFGIAERTLYRWKHEHLELAEALEVGKEKADQRVIQSLYRRATGYSHDAVKIFMPAGATKPVIVPYVEHVPPDTIAAIFWLKNRQPDQWRDKHELKVDTCDIAAELNAARLRAAQAMADDYRPPRPVAPPRLEYQPAMNGDFRDPQTMD